MTFVDLDKLNWPLKRSHFPMHDQSPGAVQGPDSIHSSQHYLWTDYQTDSFYLSTMLHVVLLLLSRSKKGDHGTSFESDREGGAESLWNRFFSVTRGRSATSTFCTYCGGCSVPRHALPSSNKIKFINQNDSGVLQ